MRLRVVHVAIGLLCPLVAASVARAQPASPTQSPEPATPTGPAIPSDVKEPPPPHKAFDFTLYGRVNVSFDVGNQELTRRGTATSASARPSAR